MSQHFDLFQLPAQFDIDGNALEQTYRVLAARFHPDKFAAASSFEQKQAVMMASQINEAYRVLKNPIDRAAYLLQAHNIDADAPEHTHFPPEFLMQQMEWREALMEAQAEQNQEALRNLAEEILTVQSDLFSNLQQAFTEQNYPQAAQQVRQGRFLDKMLREIHAADGL
ncbi:Fe-S protein assembly co-chaperone HscB [Neisseria animalis]|uniref:Co-chaperone protein HscB homolog n=1 Tax=Neisseria animalis TaxID=492 RepID=A0A5P3MU71_NEIAN|nr:Fe-S protein assembly co-chaperone HscB [Neisseria animalis]QEY25088.1 Fe-S protein assembly co-chaperone HscB [Neisseria animalis]ROW31576.1 Fe-S protein assembly co-chaperone HscB [Neisseria animalis]VEE07978.1 chaperone protein HscB [Neisseria animalis]